MKYLVVLLMLFSFTGCASLEGKFENRVTCTVDKKDSFLVSLYGPLGIASKVSKSDTAVICSK